jgi:Leucine-rich repeat (LRR) protein
MTHLHVLRISNNALEALPLNLRNLCGIKVEEGLTGNPLGELMTWEQFCQGI